MQALFLWCGSFRVEWVAGFVWNQRQACPESLNPGPAFPRLNDVGSDAAQEISTRKRFDYT